MGVWLPLSHFADQALSSFSMSLPHLPHHPSPRPTPLAPADHQFDPDCFQYILDFWAEAQASFYGTPTSPGLFHAQQNIPASPTDPNSDVNQNPLLTKQAIIVLREELEYFSITTPGALARVDELGLANDELRALKRAAGEALASKRQIFTALQRNVNKENNQAEQHLIDMLCMSGFNRDDEWGYRACEPTRNVISSMALVLLKTGIIHPGTPGAPADIMTPIIDDKQMGTAQKLLLFWRKPAVGLGERVEADNSASAGGTVWRLRFLDRRRRPRRCPSRSGRGVCGRSSCLL